MKSERETEFLKTIVRSNEYSYGRSTPPHLEAPVDRRRISIVFVHVENSRVKRRNAVPAKIEKMNRTSKSS